jgi:hypothetical protein
VPSEASGIASTDEGAAVDDASWSADGAVAQTHNQYYFKYKVRGRAGWRRPVPAPGAALAAKKRLHSAALRRRHRLVPG